MRARLRALGYRRRGRRCALEGWGSRLSTQTGNSGSGGNSNSVRLQNWLGMGGNRCTDRGDRRELLVDVGFFGRTAHEGAELGGKLALDGGAAVRLDLRCSRRLIERRLEALRRHIGGRGGNACAGDADDVGLDHDIVRTADKKKVLDIVPAQQNELPLPVEIIDIHDAEPGLAAAAAVTARHHQAGARQLAEDDAEEHDQGEDDSECDHEENSSRRFETKKR